MRSLAAICLVAVVLAGCDDGKKASEESAVKELAQLLPVIKEDVVQVRRGLPEGAKKLGALVTSDTLASPPLLKKAIASARASVKDLEIAKSTFFSYADEKGAVLSSEADLDLLAGHNVLSPFPTLKKALEPNGGVVEAFGEMIEMRGARSGPDLAWVAAAGVPDDKGVAKGLFVTGWSFRALAYHLEMTAKRQVNEAAEKAGKKNPPIVYVYVVKNGVAYGTPTTPEVNAEAVQKLDLAAKTAAGPFRTATEITGRAFGIAATRVPELGDDAVLAIVASEI